MKILAAAAWSAAGAVLARGVSGTVHAAASYRWLRQRAAADPPPARDRQPRFVLLVPLLREQDLAGKVTGILAALASTIPGTTIALVTTQAEEVQRERDQARLPELAACLAAGTPARQVIPRFLGLLPAGRLCDLTRAAAGRDEAQCRALASAALAATPTTPRLAAELASQSWPGTVVRHWHYPRPDGRMVHQVNYAIRAESERAHRDGITPDRLFFAVYNADSCPHPDTLRAAAALIGRLDHDPGGPARIIQQSAAFTANMADLPAGPAGSLLTGAGWLQSRWTLAREIPRLRRHAAQARRGRPRTMRHLAHCVGHGLIVRADTFAEFGGLPEATLNEDLAFGYLACAAGVPIDPLPLLEEADTARTVRSWISQGNQWFRSYPQYPQAASLAAGAGYGDSRRRGWLTVQGLARGALWLAQSPAVGLALALPALTPRRGRAAALTSAGLLTYYIVPAMLIARLTGRPFTPLRSVPGGVGALLISSAGPWWSLAELAWHALSGQRPAHRKTER